MSLSTLGITVVLFSLMIAGLVYLVDVNRHKDKIVAALMAHTGRAFQVQDRIRLTFYPWMGMNLGKIRVGNAQGFEGTDFADIQGVKVRIKVMPLLARRVVIDTVRLDGIDINLMRDSDGVTNWDDLVRLANQAVSPDQTLLTQPVEVHVKATANARNVAAMEGLAFDAEVQFETKLTMLIEKSLDVGTLPAS
jgi:AsmA protein